MYILLETNRDTKMKVHYIVQKIEPKSGASRDHLPRTPQENPNCTPRNALKCNPYIAKMRFLSFFVAMCCGVLQYLFLAGYITICTKTKLYIWKNKTGNK